MVSAGLIGCRAPGTTFQVPGTDFAGRGRGGKPSLYDKTMEWLGGEFDPEAFDLEHINWELKNSSSA